MIRRSADAVVMFCVSAFSVQVEFTHLVMRRDPPIIRTPSSRLLFKKDLTMPIAMAPLGVPGGPESSSTCRRGSPPPRSLSSGLHFVAIRGAEAAEDDATAEADCVSGAPRVCVLLCENMACEEGSGIERS